MRPDVLLEKRGITSDPAGFRDAREWLAALARRSGFGEVAPSLTLALNEACANAHRHGYGGRVDGRIDLEVRVDDGSLSLTVRHYGAAFDFASYRPPDSGTLRESGYGILMIREAMDDVQYTDTEVGTEVVMVKHRPSRAHTAGEQS